MIRLHLIVPYHSTRALCSQTDAVLTDADVGHHNACKLTQAVCDSIENISVCIYHNLTSSTLMFLLLV